MTGRDVYKVWTSSAGVWSGWVRPVQFVVMDTDAHEDKPAINLVTPKIFYMTEATADTAVIVDMPDKYGVEEGLVLAKLGFAPVPLYNGVDPQANTKGIVDNAKIKSALIAGVKELQNTTVPSNALPAFMLDSNRWYKRETYDVRFDNGWFLYSQDLPSANFLLTQGIKKIIVHSRSIQKDLGFILYKFQQGGIKIYFTDGYMPAKEVSIKKPPRKIIKFFG